MGNVTRVLGSRAFGPRAGFVVAGFRHVVGGFGFARSAVGSKDWRPGRGERDLRTTG